VARSVANRVCRQLAADQGVGVSEELIGIDRRRLSSQLTQLVAG
jgi:hypothetical protein